MASDRALAIQTEAERQAMEQFQRDMIDRLAAIEKQLTELFQLLQTEKVEAKPTKK